MITEDDLTRLLAEAAESVPPPGRAPDELLAALAGDRSTGSPRRRSAGRKLLAAAAAAVVVVAIGAGLGDDVSDDDTAEVALSPGSEPSTTVAASGQATATRGEGEAASEDEGGDAGLLETGSKELYGAPTPDSPSGAGGASASPEPANPAASAQPVDSAKVIKTGSLDLEVREGAFDGAVDRITAQAIGLGGYIAESTTSESGDAPSASIIVRVPATSFETLLADLRELGEVKAVSSKGTDVTAQFTDLAARLTALTATRDRLSTVLSEADNVPDILAVQDRITAVQVEIEQLQGQQRLLEDQTSFATLAITLGEPGAEIVEIESEPDEGLGHAWDEARRRFGDALEGLVSWSGSAALVLIVGLALLALSRLAWIGLRRRLV